jgi:hypothetical protein
MPSAATLSPSMPAASVPSSGDNQIATANQSNNTPVGSSAVNQSSEGRCHGIGPREDEASPDTLERYAASAAHSGTWCIAVVAYRTCRMGRSNQRCHMR